jgi:tetratricopeptide (TPR) repeat protein
VCAKQQYQAMTEIHQLLKTAIQTAKSGEREKAHQLLMQIVELDEKNETAWLWLSGTVKTKEDRQICLENVLAINPQNEIAKKGLKKLGITPAPISSQKAKEKPERWDQPVYDIALPEISTPHKSKFQDAWSSSADLCAYCAQPVQRSDKHCPKCRRRMVGKEPVFPNRSKYLIIWVALRSINHFFAVIGLLLTGASFFAILPELPPFQRIYLLGIVFGQIISIGFTAALFWRQVWAYWLAILGLLLLVLSVVGLAFLSIPLPATVQSSGSTFLGVICIAPFIIVELLYVYMVIMAGGDFKRVARWRIAVADDRIKDPLVLDKAGKMFAQRQMWATAVLYWQRAVGRSPGNVAILRRLADGYARLGFPERSIDALRQAKEKSLDAKTRETLGRQIDLLHQKIAQRSES